MILANTNYSWLPHSLIKGLDLPKIVFEDHSKEYGGYYDPDASIICVVDQGNELEASTIAHELRHHIQYQGKRKTKVVRMDPTLEYTDAIYKYFTSSWSELDALLFEYKYAKSWLNEWWLRKIVGIV